MATKELTETETILLSHSSKPPSKTAVILGSNPSPTIAALLTPHEGLPPPPLDISSLSISNSACDSKSGTSKANGIRAALTPLGSVDSKSVHKVSAKGDVGSPLPDDFPGKRPPKDSSSSQLMLNGWRSVTPGEFEMERHYYTRVLNAQIHPLVAQFFNLSNDRILLRYAHLNPHISQEALASCLSYVPRFFRWAGADLFAVTNAVGQKQMVVVETNSCPSGQKSMPLLSDWDEHGGYSNVIKGAFIERLKNEAPPKEEGGLCVLYDKNFMEASGYAAVLADLMDESVYLVHYPDSEICSSVVEYREDGLMYINTGQGMSPEWQPIRGAFRYVTQAPWKRLPACGIRTLIVNPIVACLAGGRNKMMAARAYELFNAEMADTGLQVRTPETIRNVSKSEIPLWVESWGGHAVLKDPYSNAGQGVYTITNQKELDEFMAIDHHYDKFIVQSLVGNSTWSSSTRQGLQYHLGLIPDKKGRTFVSDLRCMIVSSEETKGFKPTAYYARRARMPLLRNLEDDRSVTSWEMLGTNLSVKESNGQFTTEEGRLLLMDRKDFNVLGISIDDLIEGYVETVLSVIAIDKMAARLIDPDNGEFNLDLFRALNPDKVLNNEIMLDINLKNRAN